MSQNVGRLHRAWVGLQIINFHMHNSPKTFTEEFPLLYDDLVEQVFATLNDEEKSLLALHYLDGVSYDILATKFQKSSTSLRKKVSRTMATIRERLTYLVE